MKFKYIMGTSLIKFKLSFHKVSFIINIIFPPLHETLRTGRVKLFAETSEFFTHAVIIRKTTSSEYISQGSNRDCRKDAGEENQGADFCGTVLAIVFWDNEGIL